MPGQLGPMRRQSESLSAAMTAHHVQGGDAFGNAYRHFDPRGCRLQDGVGGEGRRYKDQRSVGASLGHSLGHGVEHRDIVHLLAALARGHSGHHFGAVFGAGPGMEGAFLAGNALHYYPCIAIYQNAHCSPFIHMNFAMIGNHLRAGKAGLQPRRTDPDNHG